ncbi:MAG: hypothetical protein QOF78_4500 [Phycisphaerales bacterium]|jgi:hypothetical protein|nr:hypothetical protein [Phycisphaerales bacterium]
MIRRATAILAALLAVPSGALAQEAPPPPTPPATVQPPAEAPAEPPKESLAEVKIKESLQAAADAAQYARLNAASVSQVIRVTINDKDLLVASSLPATEAAIVSAPGLSGLTKVTVLRQGDDKNAPLARFSLENADYSAPDAVSIHTSVQMPVPGQLHLNQDYNLLADEVHTVQLIQNLSEIVEGEPRVRLYVQITAQPEVNLRLEAENIVQLRHKFPAEVAKYVDPIFRSLRQDGLLAQVDPKLAWQVFADAYTPPANVLATVQGLVKKLDAEKFQDRETASKALEALGQPAALALLRVDRSGWSEEQVGRVDAFLAKFKTTDDAEAKRLRKDRDFLLDCLFSEEEPIRRRAHAELQKLVGRPVEFDITAPPEQRLESIKRLRASIGAAPATQAKLRAE